MKRQRRKLHQTPEVDVNGIEKATCGACLLELIDPSEQQLIEERLGLRFRKPEHCAHLYHKNCLEEWFKRDSSCPQCRLRVDLVIEIDEKGMKVGEHSVKPVFLEDVLEAEESEEISEEDGEELENVVMPRREQRPIRTRSRAQEMRRESDKRITEQVAAEAEKMRKRLAEDRGRELRRQKAILQSIDPLKVRISIIKSLRKLPYDLQTDEAGSSTCAIVAVPTAKRKPPTLSATPSFIKLKPPSYERDFLSREPPSEPQTGRG